MRILLVHFGELGYLGGVDVVIEKLAEAFAQRGFASGIVEMAPKGKPRRTLPSGVPVWTVTASTLPKLRRPRSWASFVRAAMQFRKILREFCPNIVHVHFPTSQCLPVVGAASLPHRWKLVATVHNSDIRVVPFREPAFKVWQRRLFNRADALTAVSQSLLNDTVELYDGIQSKFFVVHNGIGPKWFRLPLQSATKENYVLFVGRLDYVKGVDILLTAWKEIVSRIPSTELWIVGDGPERKKLETVARTLGASSNVRFLGPKAQDELPDLYRNARVVVLPSRREGLPLSLLEAGACGSICVGTRIPGIPEIIENGTTGFVIQPESPKELATAVLQSLQLSPDHVKQMRQAARDRIASEFSEERMIERYLRIFQATLE
jgi:glycosyltransferase involved in cell wall biosynthesis